MIEIRVLSKDRAVLYAAEGKEECFGTYFGEYGEGSRILVSASGYPALCRLRLDEAVGDAVLYLAGDLEYPVPSGQERLRFHPAAFSGERHYLYAGFMPEEEKGNFRDLALNPYDFHGNTTAFPHIEANAETRGEAVFFAANAINGIYANDRHGEWPYVTWGIDGRRDCEFTIDFGRPVDLESVTVYLRADFPHDAVWESGRAQFSDGSEEVLRFEKTGEGQRFLVRRSGIRTMRLYDLVPEKNADGFISLAAIRIEGRG